MDELAKRFADFADKYGPSVVDAALNAVHVEAYSKLVSGVMCLTVAASLFYFARWMWRQEWCSNEAVIAPGVCWIFAAVFALFGVWSIIDPWTWTAISNPELWIAKKAFKL